MPFDIGFNFRATSGYVTDPSYGVPVLGEAYPHTYTAANGYSINAGWGTGTLNTKDDTTSYDVRLAGENYPAYNTAVDFLVDLSSGSAPGAGTYDVDMALGASYSAGSGTGTLYDNTTLLATITDSTLSVQWRDATNVQLTSTTWPTTKTLLSAAFASTTVKLKMDDTGSPNNYCYVAHFRLTLAGAAQSVVPVLMSQYRQRRV